MANTAHEKEVCDRVAEAVAARRGLVVQTRRYPEEEYPKPPNPVEGIYTTADQTFVVEHTILQSYPHQISEDKKISQLVRVLEDFCRKRITSPGHYRVEFAIETLWHVKITDQLVQELSSWIVATAPTLKPGSPQTAPNHHRCVEFPTKSPAEPLNVCLYRWPASEVQVQVWRGVTDKLDDKRLTQIQASLLKKLPKLSQWKSDLQACSLLVLESIDIALANTPSIITPLLDTLMRHDHKPDVTCLVETHNLDCSLWTIRKPYQSLAAQFISRFAIVHPPVRG